MPRSARDLPPDSVSHLLSRGVEKRPIFLRDADYNFFLTQMRDVFTSFGVAVLDFALMPNHFHIQALTGRVPIGIPMQKLLTRFSLYFNHVYERIGHLFQNRFKSFEVRDDAYLVQLPVYISRNPIRAGLVQRPEQWEWSGHNELVSGRRRFLDLSRLQETTGMAAGAWRDSYLELMARGEPALAAGAQLDEILEYAALAAGISGKDVLEGVRGRPFTRARRQFAREAIKRGYSQVEIASTLACAPSSVAELLND